ncbi:[Pyruvate dehydrogenase [acetyl-transferring]]-phosphatase 1, mitochondrial [Nowakowskiella sp. JEL0078]|nr:[Pyruvate dehydrogenase [acetyl-transferring]]-phosphatase 1, mitochondrial [Nowakowskiella sp. JEL0078]
MIVSYYEKTDNLVKSSDSTNEGSSFLKFAKAPPFFFLIDNFDIVSGFSMFPVTIVKTRVLLRTWFKQSPKSTPISRSRIFPPTSLKISPSFVIVAGLHSKSYIQNESTTYASRSLLQFSRLITITGITIATGALAYVFLMPISTAAKQNPHVGGVGFNAFQINEVLKKHEKTIIVPFSEKVTDVPTKPTGILEMMGLSKNLWWESLNPTPVVRIDKNEVASNESMEDTHSEHRFGGTLIVGIFDGHGGGSECSEALSTYLSAYISHALSILPHPDNKTSIPRYTLVTRAIQSAFTRLDSDILSGRIDLPKSEIEPPVDIVKTIKPDALSKRENWIKTKLLSATRGSCAIVTYIEGSEVYVACTGDSRAVIGRRIGESGWETLEMSVDQTLRNPKEYARVLEEHPGENETAVSRGRILGSLMPTRAFGKKKFLREIHC